MAANLLSAAAYLEMGLAALRDGDDARAAGCFAAIDEESWRVLRERFTPKEMGWVNQLKPGQIEAKMAALTAGTAPALETATPAGPDDHWTGW